VRNTIAALLACYALGSAGCAAPVVTATVVAPAAEGSAPECKARQDVPAPSSERTRAPAAGAIVIKGSALQSLDDGDLAKRTLETSKGLRSLASIGRRDEAAAREGVRLTYAKTPEEVRGYILGQYTFVRLKVLDEEREITRRLGDQVEGSDAVFEAPSDEGDIERAADALEAIARRLVADP
jgi:hypothetical protein